MIDSDLSSKILIVGPDLKGKGGISTVILTYSKMFETFNYVCTVKNKNALTKFFDLLVALFRYVKKLVIDPVEIVHIHTASYIDFYRNALFVIIANILGKRILLHIHGAEFELFYDKHTAFVSYICKKATTLAVVSNYFMDFVSRNHLNQNVYLLHNIIDRPILEDDDSFDGIFNISFVGTVCERKGIYDVVATLGEFKNIFQDRVLLHIAGNGDIDYLNSLIIKYELSDMVKFWGWADAGLKRKILSFSNAFVHPSYFESFGISIVEAMSYKLPVITTAVGGIPDFMENGVSGFFVDLGNKKQIGEALQFLIDNPEICKRMGENGGRVAEQFYSDNIEQLILSLYTEILSM